jgi:hypothetical protein
MEQKLSVSQADPQICEEAENITDRIRERACELYQLRGRSDGHDLDDWLIAESQLAQTQRAKDSEISN